MQQELPWQARPLVKRRHRLAVAERVPVPDGEVLVPLDEAEVRERVRPLRQADVEAVSVCLLHSNLNPEHERDNRDPSRAKTLEREVVFDVAGKAERHLTPFHEHELLRAGDTFVGPAIEELERRFSMRTERHELRDEPCAAGEWRGGIGMVRVNRFLEFAVPNSGGYGDPLDRDPAGVANDVLDGFTTAELAERNYGVLVTADGSVDVDGTARLRKRLREERLAAAR